jgi:hypothetical protein
VLQPSVPLDPLCFCSLTLPLTAFLRSPRLHDTCGSVRSGRATPQRLLFDQGAATGGRGVLLLCHLNQAQPQPDSDTYPEEATPDLSFSSALARRISLWRSRGICSSIVTSTKNTFGNVSSGSW